MKKLIFILVFLLTSPAFATKIDLGQIVGAVDSASNGQIGKITERIENKIEKFEKKFDNFEKKIDEAEKSVDKVNKLVNSLDKNEIIKYITMAKYAIIAIVALFALSLILMIIVLIQTIRIRSLLNKK